MFRLCCCMLGVFSETWQHHHPHDCCSTWTSSLSLGHLRRMNCFWWALRAPYLLGELQSFVCSLAQPFSYEANNTKILAMRNNTYSKRKCTETFQSKHVCEYVMFCSVQAWEDMSLWYLQASLDNIQPHRIQAKCLGNCPLAELDKHRPHPHVCCARAA